MMQRYCHLLGQRRRSLATYGKTRLNECGFEKVNGDKESGKAALMVNDITVRIVFVLMLLLMYTCAELLDVISVLINGQFGQHEKPMFMHVLQGFVVLSIWCWKCCK